MLAVRSVCPEIKGSLREGGPTQGLEWPSTHSSGLARSAAQQLHHGGSYKRTTCRSWEDSDEKLIEEKGRQEEEN